MVGSRQCPYCGKNAISCECPKEWEQRRNNMRHTIFIGKITISRDEKDDKNMIFNDNYCNEDGNGFILNKKQEAELEQLLQEFFNKHF